jgi:hypothetical protein
VPPDVALLLPEPDDGGLPVLKPLEPPELLELPELEPLEVLELCEGLGALGVSAPDLLAGLARRVPGTPDGREIPDPEPTSAACRDEPGRTSVIAPAAAIPPTPAKAVSARTIDRP